jgi:hypothetical protein
MHAVVQLAPGEPVKNVPADEGQGNCGICLLFSMDFCSLVYSPQMVSRLE